MFKKFIVAADNHGSMVSDEAKIKLLDFCKTWKPDYRIHLGDLWDFSPIRRGASQEEKSEGIADDYQMGLQFLDEYKPNYLALGNHDDRIWQLAKHSGDGIIKERCEDLVAASEAEFKKRKINFVPYSVDKYLQMPEGGPKLIHGFLAGMNPAKAHFERFGSCIFGHVHAPSTYVAKHIEQGQAMAIGCMADIEQMTYAERYPNRLGWRNGWAYGLINTKTGSWNAWHVTKEQNSWISPLGVL